MTTATTISLESFESQLESCISKETSKEIVMIIAQINKQILPMLTELKKESKALLNEKSFGFLQEILEKYDLPDVLFITAQLFNKMLATEHFDSICHDEATIIYLLYFILNCIEKNKGGLLSHLLIRKTQLYMKYLYKHSKANKTMLTELMKAFPIYHSMTFKKFNSELAKSKVVDLCNSIILKDKEEGVKILANLISEKVFFAEQFELLYLSAPTVLASLLKAPKEDEISAYNQFATVLCKLLYYSNYKLILSENEEDSFKDESKTIYVINDKQSNDLNDLKALDDTIYELSYQKELLELNENIVEVCLLFVTSVMQFDKNFQLQFMCYLILRRIYFAFPQYTKDIGEYLPLILTNLCKFQGQTEWNHSLECRQFSYYLLTRDQYLKTMIKSSTAVPQNDIRYPNLLLRNIDMTIGFPITLPISPREVIEKKIEVNQPNTLVYISIDEVEDRDIVINLFKYNNETNGYTSIIEKETITADGKVVIVAKEPGIYLFRFDNSSSWFKERRINYQFNYLIYKGKA